MSGLTDEDERRRERAPRPGSPRSRSRGSSRRGRSAPSVRCAERGEGPVARAVVDDDDLPNPGRSQARDTPGERRAGVVVDDHGADAAGRPPRSAHRERLTRRAGQATSSATSALTDARQSGSSAMPDSRSAALSSTEFCGRGAGRGGTSSSVEIGSTTAVSPPAASTTAQAKPNQVVVPWFVTWNRPLRRSSDSETSVRARSCATVGLRAGRRRSAADRRPRGGENGLHHVRSVPADEPRGATTSPSPADLALSPSLERP